MATQRVTIAKLAGRSTSVTRARIGEWAAARTVHEADVWSAEQWPADCRRAIDAFSSKLRAAGHLLPVIYFSEHIDLWSMGDTFRSSLSPSGNHCFVMGDEFELLSYFLPDDGCLASALKESLKSTSRRRNPPEANWFRVRLSEALHAWESLRGEAVLIVLRQILGPTVPDEEVQSSLFQVPEWIESD